MRRRPPTCSRPSGAPRFLRRRPRPSRATATRCCTAAAAAAAAAPLFTATGAHLVTPAVAPRPGTIVAFLPTAATWSPDAFLDIPAAAGRHCCSTDITTPRFCCSRRQRLRRWRRWRRPHRRRRRPHGHSHLIRPHTRTIGRGSSCGSGGGSTNGHGSHRRPRRRRRRRHSPRQPPPRPCAARTAAGAKVPPPPPAPARICWRVHEDERKVRG